MEDYGKFKSAEELLKGYNELEKSFTQKCQQLSALEKQNSENSGTSEMSPPQNTDETAEKTNAVPEANADGLTREVSSLTADDVRQYLAQNPEFLRSLSETETNVVPNVMTGGGNVSMAAPTRPKTLAEASELVKKLFN